MAFTVGSRIEYTDLQSLYTSFNTQVTRINGLGGFSLTQLSIPSSGKTTEVSDLNTLKTKISSFSSDEFLGTQNWWNTGTAVSGNGCMYIATSNDAIIGPVQTAISNMAGVICHNTVSHLNSSKSVDCSSNGARNVACSSNGAKSVSSRKLEQSPI